MKKLFVLFLLVALVPFTVGCSLWGHDEDLDVIATTPTTVSVVVPASAISGANLRSAVSYTTLTLTVNGISFTLTGTPVLSADGLSYTVTFTANLTESQIDSIAGNSVPVVVSAGSATLVSTDISFASTITAPTLTVTAVTVAGVTTFTVAAADGATTLAIADTTSTATIPSYTVASVTVMVGATKTELNSTTYTPINSVIPTFTVELSSAYTNTLSAVKWDVRVTNKTSGISFNLESTNATHAALFTVAAVGTDKKAVTVVVKTATGTQPSSLTAGEDYEVKLIATDLTNGTALLDSVTFLFNTGA